MGIKTTCCGQNTRLHTEQRNDMENIGDGSIYRDTNEQF